MASTVVGSHETATAAAATLRALLVSVDVGEIEATEQQRDYLAGAADALEVRYEGEAA